MRAALLFTLATLWACGNTVVPVLTSVVEDTDADVDTEPADVAEGGGDADVEVDAADTDGPEDVDLEIIDDANPLDAPPDEDACVPDTCDAVGIMCGEIDDGCGATIPCGTCFVDEICEAGACVSAQSCPCDGVAEFCLPAGVCTVDAWAPVLDMDLGVEVVDLEFSGDGAWLVALTRSGDVVAVATNEGAVPVDVASGVVAIDATAQGILVVTPADVSVWEGERELRAEVRTALCSAPPCADIDTADITPDVEVVMVARGARVERWRLSDQSLVDAADFDSTPDEVIALPFGHRVLARLEGRAEMWDFSTLSRHVVDACPGSTCEVSVMAATVDLDGYVLGLADGTIGAWTGRNAEDGFITQMMDSAAIAGLAVSGDGRLMAWTSDQWVVRLNELFGSYKATEQSLTGPGGVVALDPLGRWTGTASDGVLRMWRL
ncbi:MAG: hypothetical protein KDA28_16665, partial [Phycisphaerales bacterium]|nr:hypothetical protein [Phycisphaerales bacterium]